MLMAAANNRNGSICITIFLRSASAKRGGPAGRAAGVTGYQLDLKLPGISHQIMAEAIFRAKEARTKILEVMRASIDKPRPELSKYAPRIETIKINPEKIGALIGPGGKTIKGIVAETGAEINIEDDGSVHIYATSYTT